MEDLKHGETQGTTLYCNFYKSFGTKTIVTVLKQLQLEQISQSILEASERSGQNVNS